MAFKLGSERRPNKLSLGSKSGGIGAKDDASVPGTPVVRKELESGISGEANIDGSIYISDKIEPGSEQEKDVLLHEMKHIVDMHIGRLKYDDDSVTWDGNRYERRDGKINYNGKWVPEGGKAFPWEKH
tara:strand:- start:78 stop:461 length:384 start_codon:yes stop_codon:yes gene_type:complete